MRQQLSQNWKFHIPDLKVGTLDQLVGLSDDLGKNTYRHISYLLGYLDTLYHIALNGSDMNEVCVHCKS